MIKNTFTYSVIRSAGTFIKTNVMTMACAGVFSSALAGEITQFFPVDASGTAPSMPESAWRIKWDVIKGEEHGYGGSAVMEINSVEFMRGLNDDGTQDWIQVLNNLAMVEMYVPYHDGATAFYDITQFDFDMIPATANQLPLAAFAANIEDDFVISEVVDDGIRWIDNIPGTAAFRRGQLLRLRTNLRAGNYTYSIVYDFADDGRISVNVGGTAQNFWDWDGSFESLNDASHVHMGAWRMAFALGDPEAIRVEMVERVTDPQTGLPTIQFRPFNGGQEGGEIWSIDKYTALRVTNTQSLNRHVAPRTVSYVLKTRKLGSLRSPGAPITAYDFWVSRLWPDDPLRRADAPEMKYVDLPGNLGTPEPLDGNSVVIWHNSSLFHIPRGEDFGAVDYNTWDGAAINSYAGFDLVPVNIWHKTPFLNR